jgi:hypothetical protein
LVFAGDVYVININSTEKITNPEFNRNFEIQFRKYLLNSGRIKLGGYYKHLENASDIQLANREIRVDFTKNSTYYEALVTLINLNKTTLEFSFSKTFSYNEFLQPSFCAKILSEKFLEKIRIIAIVIDKSGSDYVLDAGENLNIKKGNKFRVMDFTDSNEEANIIGELEIVSVQKDKCSAKVVNLDGEIDYGTICLLVNETNSQIEKDCSGIFLPSVLQTTYVNSLIIRSRPPGCEIYLDNCKYEEKTPVKIDRLKQGLITLSLYKTGYKRHIETIDIPKGAILEKFIKLEKNKVFGILKVNTKPSGAQLLLDGEKIGFTPLNNFKLKAGYHKLILKMNGYQKISKYFRIEENERKNFSYVLEIDSYSHNVIECANQEVKKYILNTIKYLKINNPSKALNNLKRAYEIDNNCQIIFYLKGVIEWIDLGQRDKAIQSLQKAQSLGFQFNETTPHPENLDVAGVKTLFKKLEKQFSLK